MPTKSRYLFFDTETNGLPGKAGGKSQKNGPNSRFNYWPRVVQLAWILADEDGNVLTENEYLIRPDGWEMSPSAQKCHGISVQKATEKGLPISLVLQRFSLDLWQTKTLIAHNIQFDLPILGAEYQRAGQGNPLLRRHPQCTMKIGADFLRRRPQDPSDSPLYRKSRKGNRPIPPSLSRLYAAIFGSQFEGAHDALVDTRACMECFFAMKKECEQGR